MEMTNPLFENDRHTFGYWDDLGRRAPMAIIATDISGIIQVWSPGAAELYGWQPEEVIGTPIQEVTVGPVQRDLAEEIMGQVVRGIPWKGTFHARDKGGAIVRIHVVDIPLRDDAGGIIGVVGISFPADEDGLTDSPRVSLDDVTREISLARRRDRSHIAHVLHDDVAQTLGAARTRLLDAVDGELVPGSAARQALTHIDQTLAVVRKEVDSLLDVDIDVWELLLRINEYAFDMQRRTGTMVEHDIVGSMPNFLAIGEKVAMIAHSAVREALRNCERHARANHVSITTTATPRSLCIEVRDDGRGMTPSTSGVGLRIMRESIERLGGTLEVSSTNFGDRTGTCIGIDLPTGK